MDPVPVLTVILVIVVIYYYATNSSTSGSSTGSHFESGDMPLITTPPATGPANGEDNPISQRFEVLKNNGLWNTVESGFDVEQKAFQGLLRDQGVLNGKDEARHALYYGSNVGKYPFVGRPTNIDHKLTIQPYVGFTRAMRGVNIRPTESIVPDKLNMPVVPIL